MKSLKLYLIASILLSVQTLTGCATAARSDAMVASSVVAPIAANASQKLLGNVAIGDVTGGASTNPMWLSKIGGAEFEKALEASLKSAGFLSANRQSGDYKLVADLREVNQPLIGFDMTVTSSIEYQLIDRATGKNVYRETISAPDGTIAIFPIKEDGVEMRWGLQPSTLRTHLEEGWVKWGNWDHSKLQPLSFSYLASGAIADLKSGKITITGRDANNSVQLEYVDAKEVRPMSVWNRPSHAAGLHGSMLLNSILPNRHFPFPKSLYAVEDSLRFVVGEKPDAVIVDFFSGSGTTCHAVMRLNRQDSGSRTCISITNNEVSDKEQKDLIGAGLRPGDADWEKFGICDYITKPRLASAITGVCPDGNSIQGSYKFADEFEMAEGFNENIEFFTLTYEVPLEILSGRTFSRISPLLWMRAGCAGGQIEEISDGWGIADHYAILIDLDKAQHLLDALSKFPNVNSVFIFTNEDRLFQSIVRLLPTEVEPVRMYESFIRNSEQDALGVTR